MTQELHMNIYQDISSSGKEYLLKVKLKQDKMNGHFILMYITIALSYTWTVLFHLY